MKKCGIVAVALSVISLLSATPALAQEGELSAAEVANANNPLASMKAFNVHNYYTPSLSGVDGTANTFWFRYAQPVGRFLVRLSVPLPTVPLGGAAPPTVPADPTSDSVSGVGDLNIFAAYLAVSEPAKTFGFGPLLAAPTATNEALGSEKWQGGVAAVFFKATPVVQYGGLLTWQASFAGEEERDDTNVVVAQPFAMFQIGGGTYLRTAPLWVFNIEQDTYHIPFGFGIGQVLKQGNTVFNIFIEPQFTILHKGVGQPRFQLFMGMNTQFGG